MAEILMVLFVVIKTGIYPECALSPVSGTCHADAATGRTQPVGLHIIFAVTSGKIQESVSGSAIRSKYVTAIMREQSACPYEFLESLFGNIHETEDILRVCRQDLVFRTMKIPDDIALYLPGLCLTGFDILSECGAHE